MHTVHAADSCKFNENLINYTSQFINFNGEKIKFYCFTIELYAKHFLHSLNRIYDINNGVSLAIFCFFTLRDTHRHYHISKLHTFLLSHPHKHKNI